MTNPPTVDDLVALATETLSRTDRYAVIELLVSHDPQLAAQVYQKLQIDAYWKQKNLPATIAVSQAGIHHCLNEAGKAADAGVARNLRGIAKALAFNLASFTWPGWNEEGIPITPSDLAIGLEAARLNVRLAQELDRPDKAKANALWTLGAQQLAAGNYDLAGDTFVLAKSHAVRAQEKTMAQMLEGYLLMAQFLAQPGGDRTRFNGVVDALRNDGTEDGKGFAEQLSVAMKVFHQRFLL